MQGHCALMQSISGMERTLEVFHEKSMLRKHETKALEILETLATAEASLHDFPCPHSLMLQRRSLE